MAFVAMMASSNGTRYLDMFGGDNFHSWKLQMSFLLKREGYWKLVVGEEPKSIFHTPIERNIQERMSGEGAKEGTSTGTNDASSINRNIAKWMECDFNVLSIIAFYLKDEPLQQIVKLQKKHAMS